MVNHAVDVCVMVGDRLRIVCTILLAVTVALWFSIVATLELEWLKLNKGDVQNIISNLATAPDVCAPTLTCLLDPLPALSKPTNSVLDDHWIMPLSKLVVWSAVLYIAIPVPVLHKVSVWVGAVVISPSLLFVSSKKILLLSCWSTHQVPAKNTDPAVAQDIQAHIVGDAVLAIRYYWLSDKMTSIVIVPADLVYLAPAHTLRLVLSSKYSTAVLVV